MNRVDQAFAAVDRSDFLPPEARELAAADVPIPIGHGQTNSQPSTVARMLDWLDPRPGDRVLDVGAGSGWTTALLAELVGPEGTVIGTERIPELVRFARRNLGRRCPQARIEPAGKGFGRPQDAPYDRILVSAAAQELPMELVAQLKPGGRMVIPVGSEIQVVDKRGDARTRIRRHYGYAFVPLVD